MATIIGIPTDLQVTILNAATATGAGAWFATPARHGGQGTQDRMLYEVDLTGAPATLAVNIEGTSDVVNGPTIVIQTYSTAASGLIPVLGLTAPFVRANVTTLTGGTSPTVTVKALAQS